MTDTAKRDLLATYMQYGFDDENDLDFYIQEFLGYTIPKHSFCVGHVSPFKFLCDVFFERANFVLAFGSRTSGKTTIEAIINHANALFRQVPVEMLITAAANVQTDRAYTYFKNFLEDNPLLYQQLAEDPIQSRTKFKNGSLLQVVSGTTKALNGPHPSKVSIDEVELMDLVTLEQGLSMAMTKHGIKSQTVMFSTRKTSNGTMSTLIDEQQERQLSVYNFCIWETLERCTRECHDDPEFGDCIAFDKCKGKAHSSRGWYPVADFIQKTANLSKSMFATEWENKTPSGGMKVYGEHFDEEVHVLSMVGGGRFKTFQSVFQEKEIPKNWRRIGGMDFGANFAFGMIAIEPRYDIWILFFEYFYNQDRLLGTHANIIKSHPYWRRGLPIFSDPSAKQSILEMRAYGLNCLPAMNDLAEGVDEVKKRLEVSAVNGLPRFFVMDTCIETRREFGLWEHGSLPDGKPDLDTYEDGNDHCLDGAVRYPIFTYPRMPKSHTKPITVVGV
jgi:hypothetical protein